MKVLLLRVDIKREKCSYVLFERLQDGVAYLRTLSHCEHPFVVMVGYNFSPTLTRFDSEFVYWFGEQYNRFGIHPSQYEHYTLDRIMEIHKADGGITYASRQDTLRILKEYF